MATNLNLWIVNAVKAAGRAEGSGAKAHDKTTGVIDASIANVPHARGTLPPMSGDDLLQYLADLGYIKAHDDKVTQAALSQFIIGATGFYVGAGLMLHHISAKQFNIIRGLIESPEDRKGFDAAVSLHIGRVVSPHALTNSSEFGGDESVTVGDVASSAGGDLAKGAAVGASVAAATGTIIATGAAIGTAIPIPVVGTAVGAAVGAVVGGVVAIGEAIFDSGPKYSEDDYNRMRKACIAAGGKQQSGIAPDQSNACMFPDGYRDGGYTPSWPSDRQATYKADQEARKIQGQNLASYIDGLKAIDVMIAAADKDMRRPTALPSGRAIWMKKIGDKFADIYRQTGQDKYAPLNTQKFLQEISGRVFTPKDAPRPAPMPSKQVRAPAHAGAMMTVGMMKAVPGQQAALMKNIASDPVSRTGAVDAIQTIAQHRKGLWVRLLEFLHIKHK